MVGVSAIAEEKIYPGRLFRFIEQRAQMRRIRHRAIALDEPGRQAIKFNDETLCRVGSLDARSILRTHLFEARPSRPPSGDEIVVEPSLQQLEIVQRQRPEADLKITDHSTSGRAVE